jgi:outer membrane protein assembly factor BamB
MDRRCAVIVLSGLTLAACAGPPGAKPLVDPFPLRFPLVEAGALEIEGHVTGRLSAYGGAVYYSTREGYLTAVGAPSGGILWRFRADHSFSTSPVISGDVVLIRDDGGILYGISRATGELCYRTAIPAAATEVIGIFGGGTFLGTAEGAWISVDPGGRIGGEYRLQGPPAKITAGPAPVLDADSRLDLLLFGCADGRLVAVKPKGTPAWEFRARGAIQRGLGQFGKTVLFGDSDRMFYCLDAASGKVKWRRRLQGAPVHAAVVVGKTVALAASNSVVYRLSVKGGSLLSWEAVPSRIIYEPAPAGGLVLISSATSTLFALDARTGKRAGQYEARGLLASGAVWAPPFVVLFVEDRGPGLQRLVFLMPRQPFPASRGKE